MKKVTVVRNKYGYLVQKVEEIYSLNDPPIDKTPSVMASVELSKLLLEVADNKNRMKYDDFVDKNVFNPGEYNTTGYETTGEFIDFGDIKKSFDKEHSKSLFNCNCGNTKRFNILDRVSELNAAGIECNVCQAQYWFILKYISDALEVFEKDVYNNNNMLDVETKMVLEGEFISKVQRFPVGGQYIIYEKVGVK